MASAASSRPRWSGYGKAKPPPEPSFKPVPRIAPYPISTGVSVRQLPEPRLVDIVKCCQHFESKCAGHYDKGSLGARLLFDLSREIQDLAQSLVQHDSDRDARVRHLERVTKQWTSVFERPSEAMEEAGITLHTSAPEAVARRVVALHQENAALRGELDAARQQTSREAAALRRSLRDQASASEEQVRLEARRVRREVAADLEAARAAADEARGEVARVRAEATAAVGRAVREAVAEVRARVEEEAGSAVRSAHKARDDAVAEAARARAGAEEAAEAARRAVAEAGAGSRDAAAAADAAARQAREDVQRAEEDRDAAIAACERRLSDAAAKYAASVDARRVASLERHCAWLEGRVGELERLLDGYRSAGRAAPAPAPAARRCAQEQEEEEEEGDAGAEPVARAGAPMPELRPDGSAGSVRFHIVGERSRGAEEQEQELELEAARPLPAPAPVVAFTRPGSGRLAGPGTERAARDAGRARGGRRLRGQAVVAWVEPGDVSAGDGYGGAVFAARPVTGDAAASASGEAWRRRQGRRAPTRLYVGQPSAPSAAPSAVGGAIGVIGGRAARVGPFVPLVMGRE